MSAVGKGGPNWAGTEFSVLPQYTAANTTTHVVPDFANEGLCCAKLAFVGGNLLSQPHTQSSSVVSKVQKQRSLLLCSYLSPELVSECRQLVHLVIHVHIPLIALATGAVSSH